MAIKIPSNINIPGVNKAWKEGKYRCSVRKVNSKKFNQANVEDEG